MEPTPSRTDPTPKYKAYDLRNFRSIPQVAAHLDQDQIEAIEVVGQVFPFKTNSYVVDELIDWSRVPEDPMFVLNFPQRGMLRPHHYERMRRAITDDVPKAVREKIANEIRGHLNPHPAGQQEHNVPSLDRRELRGMQHKYDETVLFFPSQGQTCHAYCSFCFRWPQFVGVGHWKFAMREVDLLIEYLRRHPSVTDVIFTGGDPMVMRSRGLRTYLEPLLEADLPNLRTIRIGSKSLSFWPYKYLDEPDAPEILALLRKVVESGKHLAFMAHVNHPAELATPAVAEAIARIRDTGAVIRSQAPLLRHVNDTPEAWAEKWRREVELGIVPYYTFVVRDTGAQHFFGVPLVRAWQIYREAYQHVSGLARTARGPSMSADPGKIEVLGPTEVAGRRLLALRFLQAREPEWVDRVFHAEYDEEAVWIDDLRPAFGERRFFFEDERDEAASA